MMQTDGSNEIFSLRRSVRVRKTLKGCNSQRMSTMLQKKQFFCFPTSSFFVYRLSLLRRCARGPGFAPLDRLQGQVPFPEFGNILEFGVELIEMAFLVGH